jgi:hypothetical protein
MPRFSVGFGRRKSTAAAEELQNAQVAAGPSFRVLERTEVTPGKSFDGGARLSKATTTAIYPRNDMSQLSVEDNMFADLKTNRYVVKKPTLTRSPMSRIPGRDPSCPKAISHCHKYGQH